MSTTGDVKKLDVMSFLTKGNPLWNLDKSFAAMGLSSITVHLPKSDIDSVSKLLRINGGRPPRLVVNRSFCIGFQTIEALARQNPGIQWLTINHSSPAHLPTQANWLPSHTRFLELATQYPNCWYGTPDERNQFAMLAQCERVVWVPNQVELPASDAVRTSRAILPGDTVTVSLCARYDIVKNIPTQIMAAGLAARYLSQRRVRLKLIIIANNRAVKTTLLNLCDACGIDGEYLEWSDHQAYLEFLRANVDVALQASLTESFNYVTVDHLGFGIPVVGSEAIRYLPDHWKAHPNDVESIARILVNHVTRLSGGAARVIAERVAAVNKDAFESLMRRLVSVDRTDYSLAVTASSISRSNSSGATAAST